MIRPFAVTGFLLTGVIAVGPVRAQSVSEQAAADALFEEGIRLRNAGDHKAACDRFDRSQSLDPALGTLQNIGMCLQEQDELIAALGTFQTLLDRAETARDKERIAVAKKKLKTLREVVPTLLVRLPDESDVVGLEILVNGEPLRFALLGFPAPVDPGKYHVMARAPGYERWSQTVELAAKEREVVVIPRLDSLSESAQKTAAAKESNTSDVQVRAPAAGDKEMGETSSSDQARNGVTALASVGVSSFAIGDLDLGREPVFAAEAGWIIEHGINEIEVGGVLAATAFQWNNGSSTKLTRLYSMLANATVTRPIASKLRVRGQLGLGLLLMTGLDEAGHPLLKPGIASVGTIRLPKIRIALGVDYLVTPRISLVLAPLIYWYSPRLDEFIGSVDNVSGIQSTLGVGYCF